jgi:hypothetical protein
LIIDDVAKVVTITPILLLLVVLCYPPMRVVVS